MPEVIILYRYRRRQEQQYKRLLLNTIIIGLAIIIVSYLLISGKNILEANSGKNTPDDPLGNTLDETYYENANAAPEQSKDSDTRAQIDNDNYNSKANSSQENSTSGQKGTKAPETSANPDKPGGSSKNENSTSSKPERTDGMYTITVYNGKIGVFSGTDEIPVAVLDFPVNTLPSEDLELLENGIELESLMAVKSFLEDYE